METPDKEFVDHRTWSSIVQRVGTSTKADLKDVTLRPEDLQHRSEQIGFDLILAAIKGKDRSD